jgi:hypothetical protein
MTDSRPLTLRRAASRCAPRFLLCVALAACASTGTATGSGGTVGTPAGTGAVSSDAVWPTSTREHVDLWLHGYALLTTDTARVPFFRRGYRQRMKELKGQRNVYTQLDANFDALSSRFLTNPALVNGQFVPLYFSSFQQIQDVVGAFLQSGGDPRAATDAMTQALFGVLSGSFPAAADRDWLRLFVQSLADESNRFYHDYWSSEQRARSSTRQAVDDLWRQNYRPRLQRYLNNTQQENGEFMLSLPLDGEGRTVTFSKQQNSVSVAFPDTPERAAEAIFVFAHEVVNAITTTAINDNTTPAEQRSGVTSRYLANGNVRAGAILIQRVASADAAQEYMRFYLRAAGLVAPTGDPSTAFAAAFAIPDAVIQAITRQLDVVLGGI